MSNGSASFGVRIRACVFGATLRALLRVRGSAACAVVAATALLVGMAAPARAQQAPDKYAATLAKVRDALRSGDFATAENLAFALTVLDEARWEGHVALGAALLGSGKREDARKAFDAVRDTAPAEVLALATAATTGGDPGAGATGDAPAVGVQPEQNISPEPAPEEPLSAKDKTRLAAVRAIAADLNAERGSAKRTALLVELLSATATLPSARGPRIEMLFLRALAGLEADDGEPAWLALQELRKLGALENPSDSQAQVLAGLRRKGWDTDAKPDFVGEKRAKLESAFAKAQADVKARLEDAMDVEYYTGVDPRHPRYVPGGSDRFRHRLRISSIEIKNRSFVKIDVAESRERISGQAIRGFPDSQGMVRHCVLDLQCLNEKDDPWFEPDGDHWYVPPKAVFLSIDQDSVRREFGERQAMFGLPREKRAQWDEGANAEGFGGVRHVVVGSMFFPVRSSETAVAVHDSLKRWKQIAAELEALDARDARDPKAPPPAEGSK